LVSFTLSYYYIKKLNLKPFGHNKKLLITRGVLGIIALFLFFFTLQKMPLATAITIQYLSPIFTAIIAVFFLKEKMSPIKWIFFAISFAGIALMKGFSNDVSWIYLGAGVISAVFTGFLYNVIRKLNKTDHPVVIVFYFPLISIPIMLIWSYFDWVQPIGIEWLLLVLVGIFTQIAQIYLTKAFDLEEVNKLSIMKYIGVIYAFGFDYFIFGNTYTPTVLAGITLVIIGVILNLSYNKITLPKLRRLKLRK
jgi:drug/metabolite transporter (DMT)-like permease